MQIHSKLNFHIFLYRLCLPVAIIFCSLALVFSASLIFEQPLIKSHQGILDLSNWDTNKQRVVTLNGEWAFVWNDLVSADAATLDKIKKTNNLLNLPSTWNQVNYDGYELPGQGKATLLLAIMPPKDTQNFVMKVPVLTNQFQLYINGALRVESRGFDSPYTPLYEGERIRYLSFSKNQLDDTKPIIIMFHLINNRHRDGGMWETLSISSEVHKSALSNSSVLLELGISFLLGSISLLMFIRAFKNKQVSFLYLAIFAALMAIRGGTVNERLFFTFFGIQQWQTQQTIEYLIVYATVPFFALYLGHRFPKYFPSILHRTTMTICGSLMLLVVLTPAKVFSYSAPIFHLVVLVYIFLWLGAMGEHIQKKTVGSVFLFTGGLIFIIANINDILFTNNLINTTNISHVGALAFVIFSYFSAKAINGTEDVVAPTNNLVDMEREQGESEVHPLARLLYDKDSSSKDERKIICVESLNYALNLWQNFTEKDKRTLAEETKLWRITNDGGTLKTRTLDKYLKLSQIPKNPRYATVAKTLIFISRIDEIPEHDRYWLKQVANAIGRKESSSTLYNSKLS
tara:strand:+ start:209 stop:1924 length:1716 start_codon:yes stop_codon:yes gene_type:complete